MVRKHVRKTTKGLHGEKNMREAIALVESGTSLRQAAELKEVNYITLYRYVQKKKNTNEDTETMRVTPYYDNRKVFSANQEEALKKYIITCAKMCYGLDTIECRKFAYEMAKFHNCSMPDVWLEKKMAGVDWLYGFRKRNTDLTLRKPEPCSLTRATSFNQHNVNVFFTNLEDVMRRFPHFADGTRVFNLDETGTTTVQKPKKIIAKKGDKQLNKVTSAERGTLVTTCCAISATGTALPPAMVFPRKTFKTFMTTGAPTGTLGLAQQTGWMNSEIFPVVMEHFIKATSSSKENPSLFILDNHESHLAPAVLNIAKENGVTLLTIPPHTSHKLQPLDVSVFGPLQKFYNAAADAWLLNHPGKTISIYEVAGILGTAFDRAMTPTNIKSGFRKTGIFPFNKDIFTDEDFLPSEVTNRPLNPSNNDASSQAERINLATDCHNSDEKDADPNLLRVQATTSRNKGHSSFATNATESLLSLTAHDQAGPSNVLIKSVKVSVEASESDETDCPSETENTAMQMSTPSKITSSAKPLHFHIQAGPSSKPDVAAVIVPEVNLSNLRHIKSSDSYQTGSLKPENQHNAIKTPSKSEDHQSGSSVKPFVPVSNLPLPAVTPKKVSVSSNGHSLDSPSCKLPPSRSYPKAGPRLESSRGRKRGKSVIATDTPIKTEFENEALKREEKKRGKEKTIEKKGKTKKQRELEEVKGKTNKQRKVEEVKKVLFDSENAESDIENISLSSSDSSLPLTCFAKPKEGDFVVVKFSSKQIKHYVGKIIADNDSDEYDISYLRKSAKVDNSFYFPLEPDMATVTLEDIEVVLPILKFTNRTKRQADLYSFPKSILKKFNLN